MKPRIPYIQPYPSLSTSSKTAWCLDPELVKQSITPKTKAIVAVHLYGNLCDMQRLPSGSRC